MTDIQKRLCTLLDEIDSTCKANKLNYFLSEEVALSFYRSKDFEKNAIYISIIMPLKDILKLKKIIEKQNNSNREFDSIYDNNFYPDLTFKYVDKTSLCIDFNEPLDIGYKTYGLYIKINVLRNCDKNLRRYVMRLFEYGWIYSKNNYEIIGLDKKISKIFGKVFTKISRKLYKKILINLFEKTQQNFNYNKRTLLRIPGDKTIFFPRKLFKTKQYIDIFGKKYSLPTDVNKFFKAFYDIEWEKHAVPGKNLTENYIVDLKLPYEEYFKLSNPCEKIKDLQRKINKKSKISNELQNLTEDVKQAWQCVNCVGARIKMWEKYIPLKSKIMNFYYEQRWQELSEILKDYDEIVVKFNLQKVTIYFDEEIFDVYREFLIHCGRSEFAEIIEKRIPKSFKNKINVKY